MDHADQLRGFAAQGDRGLTVQERHGLVAAANEIDQLREALAPFARAASHFHGDPADAVFKISSLKIGHLRAAAYAFSKSNQ